MKNQLLLLLFLLGVVFPLSAQESEVLIPLRKEEN